MQQQCSGPQGGRKTPSGDDSGEHSPPFYCCMNYHHLLCNYIHIANCNILNYNTPFIAPSEKKIE